MRRLRLPAALFLILLAWGCARRGAPTGGPPDVAAPTVVASVPDSGAARVALDARPTITFSEGMEPRATGEAVSLAPRVGIRQRHWSGRTLSIVLEDSLRRGQTYTLYVAPTARDRHGNALSQGRTVAFSTADSFPAGRISGKIETHGFPSEGTYLWCYRGTRAPDSTARDFDALGLTSGDGRFDIVGLSVPARYHVWAFADLNKNRSFEPDQDVLAPADTTIELTAAAPVAEGLQLKVYNPRAPARVRGLVTDATGDSLGVIRVVAVAERDSSRSVVADASPSGTYELKLDAGTWLIMAYRDADRNRAWRTDLEPASPLQRVELLPADERNDLRLTLVRSAGGP